jgi:hypothetical protein
VGASVCYPLILFLIFSAQWSQSRINQTLNASVILGIVSVIHAFLVRK